MIEGRVAQILNDRELVINRGERDGVTSGMQFEVLLDPAITIMDPESGEPLGEIDRSKVHVQAIEVHEKFTVSKTILFHNGAELREVDFFRPRRSSQPTLKARETLRPLTEEESVVTIGDPVRQMGLRRPSRLRVAFG